MGVIEFCKMAIQMIISGNDIPLLPETKGYFERIIALLQQSEAHKAMWRDLKERNISQDWRIGEDLEEIEQRYKGG